MKKKLESPFLKREARVELVSLMDVMFLVLVFFVYSVFDMAVIVLPLKSCSSVTPSRKVGVSL